MNHITVPELVLWQRGPLAFTLLDVRRADKRSADGDEITGGQWRDPARWLDWKNEILTTQPAVVYCAFGHEISQGLTAALRAMGVDARHLEGGISAWRDAALPLQPIAR